jgi:hypothetical protein
MAIFERGFKEQTVRVWIEFIWLGVAYNKGYL